MSLAEPNKLWEPNDKNPTFLFVAFKAINDNKFYKSDKIRKILNIKHRQRNEFKQGMIYFVGLISDRDNITDILDNDDDDDDDDDDVDLSNEQKWDKVEKLYVKSKQNKRNHQNPHFYRYHFIHLFALKEPIKYIGEEKTTNILPMNNKNLTQCLNAIGYDHLNNIKRCVITSISKSICVGFKHRDKQSWIKYGRKPVLNMDIDVKYLLLVQG